MPRFRNLLVTIGVVILAACGGGDDVDSADSSTTTAAESTTAAPTTAAPTTETTAAPTTTTTTTTTTTPPEATPEDLAEAIVLPSGFFGADWDEEPQGDSDFAYAVIDGCDFVDGLADADGNLAEAESPVFSQFDTEIEHSVRVYTSVGHATDVVLAWAEQETIQCLADGATIQAQDQLDAGELDPFTEFAFEINLFDDHVGEPRITNLEIANTLTGPDLEVLVYVDVYFVQVGRTVSRLEVVNPDAPWGSTTQLLEELVGRMMAADPAAA